MYESSHSIQLIYSVFDLMVPAGKEVMNEPLAKRRELPRKHVLAKLDGPSANRQSWREPAGLDRFREGPRAGGLGRETARQRL
jgi:ATP-dependent DNA ligase